MSMTLISGIIGIAMVTAFLGFMVVWVQALPIIVIVVGVLLLLIYDFVLELRAAANAPAADPTLIEPPPKPADLL
jgi:hypothetical protein